MTANEKKIPPIIIHPSFMRKKDKTIYKARQTVVIIAGNK